MDRFLNLVEMMIWSIEDLLVITSVIVDSRVDLSIARPELAFPWGSKSMRRVVLSSFAR